MTEDIIQKTFPKDAVADLHLHSVFSDGTYKPEDIVSRAKKAGLSCIALTDHDTLEGCPITKELCDKVGLGFIPGVELTTYALEEEVHILGFWIDAQNQTFQKKMCEFQDARLKRISTMVGLLNRNGIPLKMEEVLAIANCKAPGRMHIAQALIQGGYCKDRDEVFSHYIGDRQIAWVPKLNYTIREAVELIHNAGGAALVAHPGVQAKFPAITEYAIMQGIDGFECFHPKHTKGTTQRLLALCEQHHLLVSGGSDCHGIKEHIHLGNIKLPIQYVEQLNQWVYSKNLKKA